MSTRSASSSAVVPGNCGVGPPTPRGVVWRRRTFVHAQSLSAVTRSSFQGSGRVREKRGGRREDALLTVSRAKVLRSPRTRRTLSLELVENNLPDRLRASLVAKRPRSPFLFYKHPGRPAEEAALLSPARGKIEGQASASLWCSRRTRQGNCVPFWQYDSIAVPNRAFFG